MQITDQQFEQLRQAAAEDRRDDFEKLALEIIRQAIRERRARVETNRPLQPWLPVR